MEKFHSGRLSALLLLCLSMCGTVQAQSVDITKRTTQFVGQFQERSFILDKPLAQRGDKQRYPLVIVLHGAYGNARGMKKILNTNMRPLIEKHRFIVAYMNGNPIKKHPHIGTWNAGICCGRSSRDKLDDVSFLSSFIEHAVKNLNADAQRVYLIGYSNGAMMAYRYICEHPEKVAAIAAVSGPVMTNNCSPEGLQGVLHVHGMEDDRVPVNGGRSEHGLARPNNYTSVRKTGEIMKSASVPFVFRALPKVKHGLNQVNNRINLPATAWGYFQKRYQGQTALVSDD